MGKSGPESRHLRLPPDECLHCDSADRIQLQQPCALSRGSATLPCRNDLAGEENRSWKCFLISDFGTFKATPPPWPQAPTARLCKDQLKMIFPLMCHEVISFYCQINARGWVRGSDTCKNNFKKNRRDDTLLWQRYIIHDLQKLL